MAGRESTGQFARILSLQPSIARRSPSIRASSSSRDTVHISWCGSMIKRTCEKGRSEGAQTERSSMAMLAASSSIAHRSAEKAQRGEWRGKGVRFAKTESFGP